MATSVGSIANHYDTLRVGPGASQQEIADAFAAEMRAVRLRPDIAVARLGQLSLAYETLRDPAKRRAYDDSLGLNRPAAPKTLPLSAPFVAGSYGPAHARYVPAKPAPKKEPARPDAPGEPRVAAFIAASLRDPPKRPEPAAAPEPQPAPEAAPISVQEEAEPGLEAPSPILDRNGANIAAGVLGLAILGLAVSFPATNADRLPAPEASAQAVTVGLPPAAPVQDYVVPPQAAAETVAPDEQQPSVAKAEEPTPVPAASSDKAETAEPIAATPPPAEIAAQKPATEVPTIEVAGAFPAAAVPAASEARLPLPNATVARTIERIGYSCGSVSSVTAAGPGAFKVTCSSGESYRAAPINGRYHFRRWDRR